MWPRTLFRCSTFGMMDEDEKKKQKNLLRFGGIERGTGLKMRPIHHKTSRAIFVDTRDESMLHAAQANIKLWFPCSKGFNEITFYMP